MKEKPDFWERAGRILFWLSTPIMLPMGVVLCLFYTVMDEVWKRAGKRPGCAWAIALVALFGLVAAIVSLIRQMQWGAT